jgi:hypothetical protein
VAFDDVYDKVTQTFPEIETIVADSAYKRPMTMKGGHEKLNDKPSSFPFYISSAFTALCFAACLDIT